MKTEELIEEFNKVADIRILLLNHPDAEMVVDACLHYMGDRVQHWFSKNFDVEVRNNPNGSNTVRFHEISWKTVFNSVVADCYIWGNIGEVKVAAQKAGYKYFTWNQRVYSIATGYALPMTTDDLDKK
jgi:hypothetical protein